MTIFSSMSLQLKGEIMVGGYSKYHPFTCGRPGCRCKLRDHKIDRGPFIEDYDED